MLHDRVASIMIESALVKVDDLAERVDQSREDAQRIIMEVRAEMLTDEAVSRMLFVAQCEEHPWLARSAVPVIFHASLVESYRKGVMAAFDLVMERIS